MYSSAPRIPRPWSCVLGMWSAVELDEDEEGLELGPGTPSSPGMAVTVSASG